MKTLYNPKLIDAIDACQRPVLKRENLEAIIDEIFWKVELSGDLALKAYTKMFDNVIVNELAVRPREIEAAAEQIDDDLKMSIQNAANNIRTFHSAQKVPVQRIETQPGVLCWQESRPIDRIGIYIPGGTAPLFSTVLMLAIPAQIAGCKEVVLCTPPGQNGKIDPHILYAAGLCGVNKIFKVGGAQAIAALTLGTESISSVKKIFGPGNQYVTAAKMKAQQFGIPIDMPAGPSELMVVADASAVPEFVAADLLSQAEHGVDSQVVCITYSKDLADKILEQIELQIAQLPRMDTAKAALQNAVMIVNNNPEFIVDLINSYGPEHLILATDWNDQLLPQINSAGSVFIGNYSPESAGDYASGTNHTLPTNGYAKSFSGVNLDAFVKKITFQEITKKGIENLGPSIELMAEAEQLVGHKNAVTVRLKTLV